MEEDGRPRLVRIDGTLFRDTCYGIFPVTCWREAIKEMNSERKESTPDDNREPPTTPER
jgi:hypothetical protein